LFTEKIGKRIRPALWVALVLCAALTMWVLVLAVSPAAARAQTSAKAPTTEAANDETQGARGAAAAEVSVVVEPGDSLWSISEGLLGPNASPRRVMKGAERIHALNRERIGADPNLVLVGQMLSIPRAMSGPPNGATMPARKAAEASGSDPRDRAARGSAAGEEAPREASGQGAVPRSGIPPEEAAEMPGADTEGKEALPDQRAVAPVPAARLVAPNDAPPGSFFGVLADARAEGRRLLGLGIVALAPLVAALLVALAAACVRGAARREARRRELWFRETYGRPYAAPDPSASREDASRRAAEVPGQTPTPDGGQTNAGDASEDRPDHMDPSAIARAKRARVLQRRSPGLRRQPPRLRTSGPRRPVRARAGALGRPLDGLPWGRARREEWEPGKDLVGALEGLPLRPGAGRGENLAGLRPHLEGALGELGRLERRGGLSEGERTRREALAALMAAVERAE